jgi:peptidoglycan/LPS O-acetylase OafA/YrhL
VTTAIEAQAAPEPGERTAPARESPVRKLLALDLLDNRYPALHGLRVLAILTVIQFHVTWIFYGEQGIPLDLGFVNASLTIFFGMDLFFMLSGFLIGSILLHSLEQSGKQQIVRFYLRRIFRTFPSYYVVLTILAIGTTLTVAQRSNLVYEYIYATNFMHMGRGKVVMFWGWSLALEEQFYLTVPLLFFLLWRLRSDRARIIVLAAMWLSALLVRLWIFYRFGPWNDLILYGALYFRTHTRFDTLIAGIILALVHRRWKHEITAWLAHPFHRALVALPSLACLWLLLRPEMFGHGHLQLVHVFAWGTITTLMYFGALLLLLHRDGIVQRALSAPLFRRIATLGYGVYLVHIPLIDYALVPMAHRLHATHTSLTLIWIGGMIGVSAASLALAYAMHVVIEKPSLRLREWLAA